MSSNPLTDAIQMRRNRTFFGTKWKKTLKHDRGKKKKIPKKKVKKNVKKRNTDRPPKGSQEFSDGN